MIRCDGAAKESMITHCLGTFSNILLDALFILGFHWDVAGAALATVLGNCRPKDFGGALWLFLKKIKVIASA